MKIDQFIAIPGKFVLGDVVCTRGVFEAICFDEMILALARHAHGDWGDVCKDDQLANEEALQEGYRLFSVYHSCQGKKFWVITEWDRSVTTVLLPEEY